MASTNNYISNYNVIAQLSNEFADSIYLAEHTSSTGSPVTIRLWHSIHFGSAQEHGAFVQEAQKLVMLRHPHILPVIDFGVERDSPYVVTEYIYTTTGSLRDRMSRQDMTSFPEQEALTILSQVGEALHYAHQQNIIHRQLTPERIIFNAKDEALLTDFAFDTLLSMPTVKRSEQANQDAYTAPEQLQGTMKKSKLNDQYALGSIAYQLFTGHQPSHPPIPPAQLNPALSVSAEQVILRAMAENPAERYPNVGAFVAALLDALSDKSSKTIVALPQNHAFIEYPSQAPFYNGASEVNDATVAATATAPAAGTFQPSMYLNGPPSGSVPTSNIPTGNVLPPASQGKKPGRLRTIALIALILLLLAGSPFLVVLLLSIIPASAATVTITPTSHSQAHTYTVNAVTGTIDATQNQVQARVISYTSPAKSTTVNATGKGHQDATSAKGALTFSNPGQDLTVHTYDTVTDGNGIQLSVDNDTLVKVGQSITIPAHAVKPGPGGNVPAYDISGTYDVTNTATKQFVTSVTIENTNDFTGGQDAFDYTFVQQSDIDSAATPLADQLTPNAQTTTQQQLHSDEQLVNTLQCAPNVKPTHKANDRVNNVTVTVSVTCKGEVYAPKAVQSMAATLLKSDVASQLGADYALAGDVVTGKPQIQSVGNDGKAAFAVSTQGVWVFQFSDALRQKLAHSIVSKSQADTTALLLKQVGVKNIRISTSGIGNALPSSFTDIKINTVNVPGLRVPPTS